MDVVEFCLKSSKRSSLKNGRKELRCRLREVDVAPELTYGQLLPSMLAAVGIRRECGFSAHSQWMDVGDETLTIRSHASSSSRTSCMKWDIR
jgi:hypothetical protein